MKASYDTSTLVLYKYFAVELEGRIAHIFESSFF